VPEKLARKAASLYGLSAVTLPMLAGWDSVHSLEENELAYELASLGYPGLVYLRSNRRRRNPAEVLLSALSASDLDSRIVEALPWVVWKFSNLNWEWLTGAAKLNDLQNRLGFVITVARRLAEHFGERDKAVLLSDREKLLEPSRLAREDTLCHDSLTEAERRWLRKHRPQEAKHWGLLTDLTLEHLSYAA
jgi:hypothetical protein